MLVLRRCSFIHSACFLKPTSPKAGSIKVEEYLIDLAEDAFGLQRPVGDAPKISLTWQSPLKTNMEPKHGGGWKMFFSHLQELIFRFIMIFGGVVACVTFLG